MLSTKVEMSNKMNQKKVKLSAVVLIAIALGTLLLLNSFWGSEQKSQIALHQLTKNKVITWGISEGEFGLDEVSISLFQVQTTNEQVGSGKVAMGEISTSAFPLFEGSKQLDIVSTFVITERNYLYTYEGSDIDSPRDLVGKTIAVPGLSSTSTQILYLALENKYNVGRDEVNILAKPPPIIPKIISKKEVDAGVIIDPSMLDNFPGLEKVNSLGEDFKDLYGTYPVMTLFVAKKSVRDSLVRDSLQALNKSAVYSLNNSKEVVRDYYQKHQENITNYVNYMKNENKYQLFKPLTESKIKAIQKVWDSLEKSDFIEESPRVEDYLGS